MNTAGATLQLTDGMLAGNGTRGDVGGSARGLDNRQRPSGISVEIANRLRNLSRDSVMIEGVECRSRFSNSGIEQVRIRMRLKQVTGLVSG